MTTRNFYDQLQKLSEQEKYKTGKEFELGYRAAMKVLSDHKQIEQVQILDFNFDIAKKFIFKTHRKGI